MAANTFPIASRAGDIQWGSTDGNGGSAGPLKTANTARDGTGTVLTVFTADATNGGYVRKLRACSAGSCTASVLRIFINNGSSNSTIANNILIGELMLPQTTATAVTSQMPAEYPLDLVLPPGYVINVTLGTTVSDGYFVSVEGGKY